MKVLITGASSGIGKSLVSEFCREGGNVVLGVGRNEESLRMVKSEFTGCFEYVKADLSDLKSVDYVVEVAKDFLGNIDVLINNAGFGLYKDVISHNVEEILNLTVVNFVVPLALIIKALPLMRSGSTVVNVITAGVHVLMSKLPIYGASKAALHYATEALRNELSKRGINVISVYPGYVSTEFHLRAGVKELRKGMSPDKVAKAIVKALKKKKKRVYVPTYLNLVRVFGPYLIKV